MKVSLKPDWATPCRLLVDGSGHEGYFVGRAAEVARLKSELLQKSSGAIIVGGHRGVGKTSFTYRAISEAKAVHPRMIPILMNATQFLDITTTPHKISPKTTIESLIRRLYSASARAQLSNNTQKAIDRLYKKAVATVAKSIVAEQSKGQMASEEASETIYSLTGKDLAFVGLVFATALAGGAAFGKHLGNYSYPLMLSVASSVFIRRLSTKTTAKTVRETDASEVYEVDRTLGNLEFDLEQAHALVAAEGYRIIYVIDELDKVGHEDARGVFTFFKNLFTLSDAHFIFIGGENFYRLAESKPNDGEFRSQEHTAFTSKYFLSRPRYADLETYLDSIIINNGAPSDEIERLKRALAFQARNDFFDLKDRIRDRVGRYDSDGAPILVVGDPDAQDEMRSRFHKAITSLLDGKYLSDKTSLWRQNEELQRKIFEQAYSIFDGFSGAAVEDLDNDSIPAQLLRDFHVLLERNGALTLRQGREVSHRGRAVQIRSYNYKGSIAMVPSLRLSDLTEFEEQFVDAVDSHWQLVLSLINIARELRAQAPIELPAHLLSAATAKEFRTLFQLDVLGTFNSFHPQFTQFKSKGPHPSFQIDQVQAWTKSVQTAEQSILASLPHIFCQLIKGLSNDLEVQAIGNNGNLFSGTASPIRTALSKVSPNVIFKKDYSKQVAVLGNVPDGISELRPQLKDHKLTHKVVLLASGMPKPPLPEIGLIDIADRQLLDKKIRQAAKSAFEFLQASPESKA